MRICHVTPHLPPDQAANALLPAELGTWAVEAGDSVTFIAHEPAQGRSAPVALAGPVTRVPARLPASALSRAVRWHTWRRAQVILRALETAAAGADLLHLHSNGLVIEVAAGWARRRGVPCVLTLYGTEIWHYQRRWPLDPFRRAYLGAGEVTFYSQGLLDRAVELGLGRQGLSVIYPAVTPAFTPRDEMGRAGLRASLGLGAGPVILNVKRLHELAGQTYLIDAFAALAPTRPNLQLVICGTGPLASALEAQVAARGLGNQVRFTGLIGNDEVARYAAAADVFALPSLLEALPTVAVEALAAGTPVVSADHPGGVELQRLFGDDVVVVPRKDVTALAITLGAAVDQPRRARPGTGLLVQTRFGPAAVQSAYRSVYARVRAT